LFRSDGFLQSAFAIIYIENKGAMIMASEEVISKAEVLKGTYTIETKDMFHMTEEREVVDVKYIKSLKPVQFDEDAVSRKEVVKLFVAWLHERITEHKRGNGNDFITALENLPPVYPTTQK
jgi:hypothetical protein